MRRLRFNTDYRKGKGRVSAGVAHRRRAWGLEPQNTDQHRTRLGALNLPPSAVDVGFAPCLQRTVERPTAGVEPANLGLAAG